MIDRRREWMAQWKCSVCGYIYDETIGDPKAGIPAGTTFEKLPDTWTCPVCGAGKEAFRKVPTEDIHAKAVTTVSDVMVAELVTWGVNVVFGLPGTSSLGLVEAIRKNPGSGILWCGMRRMRLLPHLPTTN